MMKMTKVLLMNVMILIMIKMMMMSHSSIFQTYLLPFNDPHSYKIKAI